ncbi:hypothetical protein F7725_013848 [Dissostichus mawsoni]|uniref:Uncharacterized protein n=1 Tax=Dissostichus mawsoni TaxID=36200 RepID=A0A7J5YUN3_DISMA|nr:hypothetical protein F7725_013848 [Dissostichus mawsoni]
MLPVEIQSLEGALGQREAAGGERAVDLHQNLWEKEGVWEEISEDAVVLGESLDVKRTGALPPLVLNSIQRHFHWWDRERKQLITLNV